MTSYELIDEIERFLNAFPSKGVLLKAIDRGAELFDKLEVSLEMEFRSSLGPSTFSRRFSRQLRAFLDPNIEGQRIKANPKHVLWNARDLLKQVRSRQLFAEIEYVEQVLSQSKLVNQQFDDNNTLRSIFRKFVSAYEEFIEGYELDDTLALIKAAKRLRIALDARFEIFNQMKAALMSAASITTDAQTEAITLLLYSPTPHLSRVVSKLNALTVIYTELCRLANVSESANPLIAAKVESGSLWTKLFGESQVTKLMADLIRSGVQFLHRQYTNEGKLGSMSSKIDIVETNILLEQKMRALGYDTSKMREDIQKAGAIISKQTTILLEGEGVLSLNGEKFSVGAELEKQYLEKSKTLLLRAPADHRDDEEESSNN